ncbi:hypothetical protein A2U01_0026357, partial [Trifolium medium]|nr:hypothetical protein [Trifolium medium]
MPESRVQSHRQEQVGMLWQKPETS